jgi:ketosteroid isomerase-like protein
MAAARSTPKATKWNTSRSVISEKAAGKTVVLQNVWLFEVASGRLVSARLYADTAAVRGSAG